MEKARDFQKNIYFCFIDYAKVFDCVDHNVENYVRILTWSASWEICMQIRKQEIELDMEQPTGSKWWKEYVKAVFVTLLI